MERHCIISFLTCGQGVSSRAMSHGRLERIKVTNFKRDVTTRDIVDWPTRNMAESEFLVCIHVTGKAIDRFQSRDHFIIGRHIGAHV